MGCQQIVVGEIVHVQAAAAHADGADGLVQHPHLLQHLADELDDGGVHTAGAEAGHHVGLDALCSRVDLFHYRTSLSVSSALAALMTSSRPMISPPAWRQV